MKFLRCRKGMTFVELMFASLVMGGILFVAGNYMISSFQANSTNRTKSSSVIGTQLILTLVEQRMRGADIIDVPVGNNGRKIYFRKTELPPGQDYDGSTASLRNRWGCFWYGPDEAPAELRYFETDQMAFVDFNSYGANTTIAAASWTERHLDRSLSDIVFDYTQATKRLNVTASYNKNGQAINRPLVKVYPGAKDTPVEVLGGPQWPVE